jgi:hypothetical protein
MGWQTTENIEVDLGLCSEIEMLMDGAGIHTYAALAGAYREAVADYRRTGERGMAGLARDAERELRKILARLREGKGLNLGVLV